MLCFADVRVIPGGYSEAKGFFRTTIKTEILSIVAEQPRLSAREIAEQKGVVTPRALLSLGRVRWQASFLHKKGPYAARAIAGKRALIAKT